MAIPVRHPFAHVVIGLEQHPALIVGWENFPDANGYWSWWADVYYLDGGEVKRAKVPGDRVRRA